MKNKESAQDIIARTKTGTIGALTDVIGLQQSIIDHLFLILSSVDPDAVDEQTLRQMKRAAEITDYYT